jgi:hypothetical protein
MFLLLPLGIIADGKSYEAIGMIQYFVMTCYFFLCSMAYARLAYRNRLSIKESLAALEVAGKYVETLKRFDIAVRVEFTQSKENYDLYHGQFITEPAIAAKQEAATAVE